MTGSLTSGGDFLRDAVKRYFAELYQNPPMKLSTEVDPDLGYTPTIQFKIHSHLIVLVEVSETPYPAILSMRRTEIEDLQMPIEVYCACPEEAYLSNQSDAKRLVNHGFGLVTVSQDGRVHRRSGCIPLIQRISEQEFKNEVRTLTPSIKRRLVESYERYNNSAPSGVADVAEVLEGFILKAGREAAKKGWIDAKAAKPGYPATTLDALQASPQFTAAMAAIGSVRGYVAEYRNTSHHFPKNDAQAAKKYRECRHAFLDGLKRVCSFRTSMRNQGLSGTI
jgi:hypothetical protein